MGSEMCIRDRETTVGGQSFKASIDMEALEGLSRKSSAWQPSPLADQNRRSLYMYAQRSLPDPFLATFDLADTTLPCAERDVSTVAPQALALLNGSLAHRMSGQIAERVTEHSSHPEEQTLWAWRYIYRREPTAAELALALAHLRGQKSDFQMTRIPTPHQRQKQNGRRSCNWHYLRIRVSNRMTRPESACGETNQVWAITPTSLRKSTDRNCRQKNPILV